MNPRITKEMANQIVTTKPALIFAVLSATVVPWMPALFAAEDFCASCGRQMSVCGDFVHRKDNVSAMHGQPSLGVDSMRPTAWPPIYQKTCFAFELREDVPIRNFTRTSKVTISYENSPL